MNHNNNFEQNGMVMFHQKCSHCVFCCADLKKLEAMNNENTGSSCKFFDHNMGQQQTGCIQRATTEEVGPVSGIFGKDDPNHGMPYARWVGVFNDPILHSGAILCHCTTLAL